MSKVFIDSNVILYANDARDRDKQTAAIEVVTTALREGTGVVSTQVLAEYAAVALSKLGQRPEVVIRQLLLLESLEVVQVTPELLRRSVELRDRYKVSFWDASILAAAERANCALLLSEDLNPGQLYAAVKVENPFAETP